VATPAKKGTVRKPRTPQQADERLAQKNSEQSGKREDKIGNTNLGDSLNGDRKISHFSKKGMKGSFFHCLSLPSVIRDTKSIILSIMHVANERIDPVAGMSQGGTLMIALM
jgi:hypothetical protein